jgi:hypothetical protein
MTTVVNVKVLYIRPKYKNLKEWINDPNNIYIGRERIVFIDGERYPKKDSVWANPYKLKDYDKKTCLELYKNYIIKKIDDGELCLDDIRGKNLGCWCKEPNKKVSCHGDVLISLL